MRAMLTVVLGTLFIASVTTQAGVQKPINVTGVVFDAANFACNQINARSNSEDWFTLLTAANATVQVVSGEIFRMDLTVGDSVCKNIPLNQNATTGECPVPEGSMIWKYRVMVLFQHWMNPVFDFLGMQPELNTMY